MCQNLRWSTKPRSELVCTNPTVLSSGSWHQGRLSGFQMFSFVTDSESKKQRLKIIFGDPIKQTNKKSMGCFSKFGKNRSHPWSNKEPMLCLDVQLQLNFSNGWKFVYTGSSVLWQETVHLDLMQIPVSLKCQKLIQRYKQSGRQ